MQAFNQRTGQARLAFMLIVGLAAAAACVVMFMWAKAPAASAAEETTTADETFLIECEFSHRAQVDPIVSPGGASHHMHDFFANTTTDAFSTYETLQAGGTTCSRTADKAAYWIPTTYWNARGGTTTLLQPSKGLFYYRLGDKSPNVDVQPHPAGLKTVTEQGSGVNWRCANGTWSTSAPSRCNNGRLIVRIRFPDCSNGNVDDFRANLVYAVSPTSGGPARCPSTHPIPVPQLSTNIQFAYNAAVTSKGKVALSSGNYATMHADFFNAWDQQTLEDLVDRCINAGPFTSTNPRPPDCA
jgi:hypothetical protein